MGWADDMGPIDDDADEFLGDDIAYQIGGRGPFIDMKGFVQTVDGTSAPSYHPLDAAPEHNRVKVQKKLVPEPSKRDRITSPMLDAGVWRPSENIPETAGRYWLIEVQRTTT